MKKIRVALVKGDEGYCLLITDKSGNGYRIAGPKAWGNPTNIPTEEFEINADELIKAINNNCYEENK